VYDDIGSTQSEELFIIGNSFFASYFQSTIVGFEEGIRSQ